MGIAFSQRTDYELKRAFQSLLSAKDIETPKISALLVNFNLLNLPSLRKAHILICNLIYMRHRRTNYDTFFLDEKFN